MKKKPIPKYVPILNFVSAGMWLAVLCISLYYQTTPTGLLILQGLCVLVNLVVGVDALIKYKKGRKQDE